MSKKSTIKSLLETKIDEMINSILLRINLNAQFVSQASPSKTRTHELIHAPQIDSMPNHTAEKVIVECNHTINKLFFLKSALTEIGEADGVYFLDNYHLYSFDDFCQKLYQRSSWFQK